MRRFVLLGLFAALPLLAVPFVWAGAGGGAREASLAALRDAAAAPARPVPVVGSLAASARRVSFQAGRAGGVEVTIENDRGRVVRRLGHFTLSGPRPLVLRWDGRRLPPGAYTAVVVAPGATARTRFRLSA